MNTKSQRPRDREDVALLLNAAIEAVDLAEESSSIAPAKAAFSTVGALLTTVKDNMVGEMEYVELGLDCADICRALDQGMKGKELGDLRQSVRDAINRLTTTTAEIQGNVIRQNEQNLVSRLLHARCNKEKIASWKLDLNLFLHIIQDLLVVDSLTENPRLLVTERTGVLRVENGCTPSLASGSIPEGHRSQQVSVHIDSEDQRCPGDERESGTSQASPELSPGSSIDSREVYNKVEKASTQGSPQVPEDAAVCDASYPVAFSDTNATRGYPDLLGTHDSTMHHIRGMPTINGYYDTVMGGYGFPPLPSDFQNYPIFTPPSQEISRVMVEQPSYRCGNHQKCWSKKPSIYFCTRGRAGMKLLDAKNGIFKDMDGRDDFPFDMDRCGIIIRIHLPGYLSSTDVERRLKRLAGEGVRQKARSMQLSARNYKSTPEPVTKSKLAQEVAKRIQWHIADLEANGDLFPFDEYFDKKWHLDQGMKFERMVITQLDNVSVSSWSPVIYVE